MIIWNGFGFLVAVITFILVLLAEYLSEAITKNDNYYQEHMYPMAIALFLSGILNGFLGKWLNNRNAKTYIDKETGKEIIFKKNNSLFFIPMEYWSIILILLSIIVLFLK